MTIARTKEITICLHASDESVADKQLEILQKDLSLFDKVNVRKRSNIHPDAYVSYSKMVNTAISDSKTDVVVLINDKVLPNSGELKKIISLLDAGFGYVGMYSIGFCGLSKSLIKKIGWLDERYLGGGYEDDDFILRLKLKDIAIYDSIESNYNYMSKPSKLSVDVPLSKSEPHFINKWKFNEESIEKLLKEEEYEEYSLAEAKSKEWLDWNCSVLGYYYGVGPKIGIPENIHVSNFQGISRAFRTSSVPYSGQIFGKNKCIIDVKEIG